MKTPALLFLCLTVSVFTYGQLSVIPRTGATLSRINWEEDGLSSEPRAGFTIGLGLNIPFTEIFSFQPELNFIQKGSKGEATLQESFDEATFDVYFSTDLHIDYLEVPLLLKFTFGEGTKFFFTAGPGIAVGIGGRNKIKGEFTFTNNGTSETYPFSDSGRIKFGETPENPDPESIDTYINNRLELSLQAGAGVLIKNKVMLDLRYGLGLTDLSDDGESKNRVLQLTAGMPIPVKKAK